MVRVVDMEGMGEGEDIDKKDSCWGINVAK